jgi:hypothetical protein
MEQADERARALESLKICYCHLPGVAITPELDVYFSPSLLLLPWIGR